MGWFSGSSDGPQPPSSSSDSFIPSFDTGPPPSFADSSLGGSGGGGGVDFGGASSLGQETGDAELQKFIAIEQQKAQLQVMISKINETCWDTCVSTPDSKMSSKTETCLSNCVERYIDSSLFITNRFAQLLSKTGGGM